MEFNDVFSRIKLASGASATEEQMLNALSIIRREINEDFLIKNQDKKIDVIFSTIWNVIFFCFSHTNKTVKSAASRTAFTFLFRCLPSYTDVICRTFGELTYDSKRDSSRSTLIISSFMLISHFMAPQHINNFASMLPLVDHFTNTDTLLSDNLVNIIKNLGPLTDNWFELLLAAFLKQITNGGYQNISAAIGAIIKRNPTRFLPCAFSLIFENSDLTKHLPLISYILSIVDDTSSIDLYPAAAAAVELLKQESANFASIDSALQVLSIATTSFRVSIKKEENNFFVLTVKGRNDESLSVELIPEKFANKPSFYGLPLPIDYLIPQENDSPVTIAAKLKSIGMQAASISKHPDISFLVSIFDKYVSDENNFIATAATASLSHFVNRILDNLPLMHKALLCKVQSWLHGVDILSVIKEIDFTMLPTIMVKELSYKVIELCHAKSEKLSSVAINAIAKIACPINRNYLMDAAMEKLDVFDDFSTLRGVEAIYKLLVAQPALGERGAACANILIEALEFHMDSAPILNEIFKCLSLYRSQDTYAAFIALALVKGYDEIITGKTYDINVPLPIVKRMKVTAAKAIESFNSDISLGNEISEIMKPASSALNFLFNCGIEIGQNILCDAALKFWNLFPCEVSRFLATRWSELKEGVCTQLLAGASKRLHHVASFAAHESWCVIMMKIGGAINDPSFKATTAAEAEASRFILSHALPLEPPSALNFAVFVMSFFYDSVKDVAGYLKRVDRVKQINFLSALSSCFSNAIDVLEPYAPTAVEELKGLPNFVKVDVVQEPFFMEPVEIKDEVTARKEFMRSAYECNASAMRSALRKYDIMKLDFHEFEVPDPSKKTVSAWVARHCPQKLNNPLEYIRTDWKTASVASLKVSGNAEIEKLLNTEKISKQTICNLCAATQSVRFDATRLFALAIRLCFEAQKPRRRRIVYQFLATCISNAKMVPLEIPDQFMDCVEMNPLSAPEEEALVILAISRRVRPSQRLIDYAIKLAELSESIDRISIVLVSLPAYQTQSFTVPLSKRMQRCLQGEKPSSKVRIIRTATQMCVAMPPEQAFPLIEQTIFASLGLLISKSAIIIQESVTLVINALMKPFSDEFKGIISKFITAPIDTHLAKSSSLLFLVQVGLKAYPRNSPIFKTFRNNFIQLFAQPAYLNALLQILAELIKGDDQANVQSRVTECMRASISQPFALAIPHLVDIWTYFLLQSFPPVYSAALISQSFVSIVPFYQLVGALHLIYRRSNYDPAVAATLTMIQTQVSTRSHAECIGLVLNRGDFKKACELALRVDDSCLDEAAKIPAQPTVGEQQLPVPTVRMQEVKEPQQNVEEQMIPDQPANIQEVETPEQQQTQNTLEQQPVPEIKEDVPSVKVEESKDENEVITQVSEDKEIPEVAEENATVMQEIPPVEGPREMSPVNEEVHDSMPRTEETKENPIVINENEVFDENMQYPEDDDENVNINNNNDVAAPSNPVIYDVDAGKGADHEEDTGEYISPEISEY